MSVARTILIADGSPRTVPELQAALRDLDCAVLAVSDATFVLTMAMRHKPALVILGAHLPAGGALTALRRLRASVHTASIPVIALAAPGAAKQALLSAGAQECLEPPVVEGDIMDAVRGQLRSPRAVTEAPAASLRDPDRLSALAATGLLDSDPDATFDLVTRLAAQVLRVPVALVSLVDERRQFFKSQVGLPAPWDEKRQTPLSHSFCQWVVSSEEELVVADARTHPVLRGNGAVADLGVVAYAGIPLTAPSGQPIGSFCAIDGRPRQWTHDELALLRDFAQLIDAQAALHQSVAPGLTPEASERHFRSVARAAGSGFLGAARLLRRGRTPLNDEQREDLAGIIERNSHRLVELTAEALAVTA